MLLQKFIPHYTILRKLNYLLGLKPIKAISMETEQVNLLLGHQFGNHYYDSTPSGYIIAWTADFYRNHTLLYVSQSDQ